MSKKDWCTGFFEEWYQWYLFKGWLPALRKVYIGDLCKKHDNVGGTGCSAHAFAEGLLQRKIFGGVVIFSVASIACWVLYTKDELDGI